MTTMNSPTNEQIIHDLEFLSKFEVVIYGSYASGDFIEGRSDIDVAIITRISDKNENVKFWKFIIGKTTSLYDIKIFELLPLYLQMEIIRKSFVLYGDPLEISEYFYDYRKIWNEMDYRIKENQFHNSREKQEGLLRRKKYLQRKFNKR